MTHLSWLQSDEIRSAKGGEAMMSMAAAVSVCVCVYVCVSVCVCVWQGYDEYGCCCEFVLQ